MVQVLSNIEVLLLSIINEKPSYAYEIDKTIDMRNMRDWARIGVASIYQVLKRLEEKNLVYSKNEKEGRMPERKRYYVTYDGKAALIEASERLLSNFERYYLDLNVGLEASDLLTPDEIAGCIVKRLGKVQTNIKRMQAMYADEKVVAFKKKAVIGNLIRLREAEEHFLQEFLQLLSTTDDDQ
jgi:DNA-binding PadR family transcriptional regulator